METKKSPANLKDLVGKRFGKLVVVGKAKGRYSSGGQYKAFWECVCDCGNKVEISGEKLRKGHTKSCGCLNKDGWTKDDLTGQKFGRLTVIRFIPPNERTARGYSWWCKCDCGNEVKAYPYKLKKGLQQSCGCLKEEMKPRIGEITKKYQHINKRLYAVYKSMLDRCYNPKHREWNNYGGRGIKVCKEWLGEYGYDAFAEWAMKTGYDPNADFGQCTIDRKDGNKDYEPKNCTWRTNKQQQNNKRNNVILEYNGVKHTLMEWSRILDVTYASLYWHCRKKHRSIEEALRYIQR